MWKTWTGGENRKRNVFCQVKSKSALKLFPRWHEVQLAIGIKSTNINFFKHNQKQRPARKFLNPTGQKDINTLEGKAVSGKLMNSFH